MGNLDAITRSIVEGLFVLPKHSIPTRRVRLKNHPSFDRNPAAQRALGPTVAKWLYQGILEYIGPRCRPCTLYMPGSSVDKKTDPFFRLVLDARDGNSYYDDWGGWYNSVSQLCDFLRPRSYTFGSDLKDAYHLFPFVGCGGGLREVWRPAILGKGVVKWVRGWMIGCSPETCSGTCDKALSGFSIGNHDFRFACTTFGQKTAGSPLNAIALTVVRKLRQLSIPIHALVWVDDFCHVVYPPLTLRVKVRQAGALFAYTFEQQRRRRRTRGSV